MSLTSGSNESEIMRHRRVVHKGVRNHDSENEDNILQEL